MNCCQHLVYMLGISDTNLEEKLSTYSTVIIEILKRSTKVLYLPITKLCWKAFHFFVRRTGEQKLSLVFKCLSFLFHDNSRAKFTIFCHTAARADPLIFSFDVSLDGIAQDLLRWGLILCSATTSKITMLPFWSLSNTLNPIHHSTLLSRNSTYGCTT